MSELTSGRKLEFQHYYVHKTAIHLCTGLCGQSMYVCVCVPSRHRKHVVFAIIPSLSGYDSSYRINSLNIPLR